MKKFIVTVDDLEKDHEYIYHRDGKAVVAIYKGMDECGNYRFIPKQKVGGKPIEPLTDFCVETHIKAH